MQIKVFKAETMKEAMAAMKAELGEDAVILHSRKYKKGGFLGFGGKEIIEITAAVEVVPLTERVRGIYKKPVQQNLPEDFIEGKNESGNGAGVNSTFNDDLPIDRPEKNDVDDHPRTQSEKLAETVRNAQNPTFEETLEQEDTEDESQPISEEVQPSEEQAADNSEENISEEKISDAENISGAEEKVSEENVETAAQPTENAEENVSEENISEEKVSDAENISATEEKISEENVETAAQATENTEENISTAENIPAEEKISEEEIETAAQATENGEENLPPLDDENISEEELPLDENLPLDEELPLEDELTGENQFLDDIPIDSPYTEAQQTQGFGFTPDQLAQAQAMMFAQFNQYQMAMAQMQAQAQAEVAEMAEQMRELHRRRLSTAGKTDTVKLARMTPEEKKIHHLENEVARMKNILTGVMGRSGSPNSVTLREALTYQEVDEEILDEMEADTSIGDTSADVLSNAARLTLSNYLEEHLKFAGGIKLNRHGPRIVAMLGTTGVGKTTTLAKIAAKFVLEHRIEAVLVTADTYRISAVEQLKTYSDILGLPLEIVYSPAELNAVIEKHKNRELILIDTAGRSRHSFQQMQELKDLMSVHSRIEKHLVISATTKITDARDMIDKFSIVEPEKVIVTKVDETGSLGMVMNLLKDSNLMISYFTTGQGVPEDIELANVNVLTDLILKKTVGE